MATVNERIKVIFAQAKDQIGGFEHRAAASVNEWGQHARQSIEHTPAEFKRLLQETFTWLRTNLGLVELAQKDDLQAIHREVLALRHEVHTLNERLAAEEHKNGKSERPATHGKSRNGNKDHS